MSAKLTADLKAAFVRSNLLLVWRWLNTSPNIEYKNYFRSLYQSYALSLDENISKLNDDLLGYRYRPEHATKLYIPKKSGILRPYSLLKLNDQLVYLALISIVAEKLYKKAKKNYNKSVFGHLYAGKKSNFFYLRWSDGYVNFNRSINHAFKDGYKWAASFDLTAYYDSIDHKVLCHFLEKIGLTKEFNEFLTNCLEKWTASNENRIYHGHGIPQGPMASGLLSEVILQHFDEHKSLKKSIKYFRYVDDIRILGKTETDVRKALLQLDYVSKEVGLFPQSGKINIHKIIDIEEEIKSISLPPEPIDFTLTVDQTEVIERINNLSKGNKVDQETRFKYVLAHALPNQKLALKLLSILDKSPHLYQSILRHFSKYPKLSKLASEKLLSLLMKEQLYEEVTAAYLLVSLNKVHTKVKGDFIEYCIKLHKKRKNISSPNLRSIVFVWLLNDRFFKFSEINTIYTATKEWWLINNSLEYLDIDEFGEPSYQSLLNSLIKSNSFEIAIKAAFLLASKSLKVTTKIKDINDAAQIILKKTGLISKTSLTKSNISLRISNITGISLPDKNWKDFLKKNYLNCERISVILVGYYNTDATAFINQFDVLNDHICQGLFSKDGRLGTYTLGSIGSILSTTSRFASFYPKYFALCHAIHELRYESELSHPKIKRTSKLTRRIKHSEIRKLIPLINGGFQEITSILS
jgi:hypothetical protein